ncbi:hypothetical protein DBR28_20490 [Chryseobacterium sp. HMWF028]|nr:hypothetical protein DBR28_20490 [Chryseobacterium sp. HMWF028]
MKDRALIPFKNMYYGVLIVSLLMYITGLLSKFKFIVTEEYNFENWISGGIIIFISGTILFGVSLLFVLDQEENENQN